MSNNSKTDFKAKALQNGRKGKRDAPGVRSKNKSGDLAWQDVPAEDIKELVSAVSAAGGAPMFITSSDSGALGVRVYHDDVTLANAWANDLEELSELLHEIALDYIGHTQEE